MNNSRTYVVKQTQSRLVTRGAGKRGMAETASNVMCKSHACNTSRLDGQHEYFYQIEILILCSSGSNERELIIYDKMLVRTQ